MHELVCRVESFPRWQNLEHFSTITDSSFNDGSAYRDISKVRYYKIRPSKCLIHLQIILLVSHNVITESTSPYGFQLLKCIHKYQVLNMYLTLDVHDEDSITAVKVALLDWEKEIKVSRCTYQLPLFN